MLLALRRAPGTSAGRSRRRADLAHLEELQLAGRVGRRGLRRRDSGLVGEYDGLDAVAQVQLREDVRDVGLDGRRGDDERIGDLRVRETARDQLEHLELTV